MPRLIRIGLALSMNHGYAEGVLRGIAAFARQRRRWLFYPVAPVAANVAALAEWNPAGIIAYLLDRDFTQALRALRRPVISVASRPLSGPEPVVGIDDLQIGETGAAHFLDRGFRSFAFIGTPHDDHLVLRERGFVRAVQAAGHQAQVYANVRASAAGNWKAEYPAIRSWLAGLAKPVAIMASNDMRAWQVAEACRACGIAVPEQAALLGVDNDETLCQLAWPPLSSIAVPAQRIGFEAAAMLERAIAGRVPPQTRLLLPPVQIQARQSSDILAIADGALAAAVGFIREHSGRPLRVGEVAKAAAVSRRVLERKFRAGLGRSPQQEIHRAHLERARRLLAATDLAMDTVAARSGLSDAKHLATLVRQRLDTTPTAYRRSMRGEARG